MIEKVCCKKYELINLCLSKRIEDKINDNLFIRRYTANLKSEYEEYRSTKALLIKSVVIENWSVKM